MSADWRRRVHVKPPPVMVGATPEKALTIATSTVDAGGENAAVVAVSEPLLETIAGDDPSIAMGTPGPPYRSGPGNKKPPGGGKGYDTFTQVTGPGRR